MKTNRIYPGRLIGLLLIIFLLIACNKKPANIGLNLQPDDTELSIIFDNSAGLLVYSVREDSVRTDVNVVKTGMLGSMLDPIFGKTSAEIFSQFRLSESGHNFGTDPILDSIVLSLSYSGVYGDSMASQTIRVYELSDSMSADASYYSNQSIAYDDNEIGNLTFVPNTTDSVNVGGTMKAAQLRISLSQEFGQKIMAADPTVFDDNIDWLEFMKGLKITTEPTTSGGAILQFDMFAANTELSMFYRTGNPEDTLSFTFLSNSNCARFTAFDHNEYQEASSDLKAQILNGDTAAGANYFYLQSMGGVKAQIRLPDIQSHFSESQVAINEAKLIMNVFNDGSDLEPPPQFGLALIDYDGDYVILPDANEAGLYYGGYLNDEETQYYFRISRHVQQVLTGETPNYPLALIITGGSFRSNRVVLYGPDSITNGDLKMKLNVIYTQVNNN